MLGQKRLKRIALLFFVLSILLWATDFLVFSTVTCLPALWNEGLVAHSVAPEKGVVQDILVLNLDGSTSYGLSTLVYGISDITRWFTREVNSHFPSSAQSVCPPVKTLSGGTELSTLSRDDLHEKFDYFGTITALGNFRLAPFDDPKQNYEYLHSTVRHVRNITYLFEDSVSAFTSFSGVVSNKQVTRDALTSIQELGIRLVTLANHPISLHVSSHSVQTTVHILEAANIQWLGLNAKKHHIAVIGGQRVGFLAMCAGYGQCVDSSNMPFAPLKYSHKSITISVSELKEHGVDVIVVLMNWGRDSGTYPDETSLAVARRTAQLGVNLIVGYGPNAVQDHAYFGSTLVIFSMGNVISFETTTTYCWKKVPDEWTYDNSLDHCKIVHPTARQNLQYRELHTRMYKIHLSRSQPAIAEYITLPLELDTNPTSRTYGLRRPIASSPMYTHNSSSLWTIACGASDKHCLSCEPY